MADGDDVVEAYRTLRPTVRDFTDKLHTLLDSILKNCQVDAEVTSRTKSIDSFAGKLQKKGAKYSDPIRQITDLSGLRVIVYYHQDIEVVTREIEAHLAVDRELSVDKGQELGPNEFGYVSTHLIVGLEPDRAKLVEWRPFAELRAEIQIRTVTQHAWAAIEHKLNYKRRSEVPAEIRRRLICLNALFEMADEQFSQIRTQLETFDTANAESVRSGDLDIPLSLSSIQAFVSDDSIFRTVADRFSEAGWDVEGGDDVDAERARDDQRDFLEAAYLADLATVADLRVVLDDTPAALRADVDLLTDEFEKARPGAVHGGTIEDLSTILFALRCDAPDVVGGLPYLSDVITAVEQARRRRRG